jgi:ubiquinone/menaquinone biosynthesis C-methylase UbiE
VAEAFRVLKPGGRFYCLEAARIPFAPLHWLYLKYMDWCLPFIARVAVNDPSAYNYLLRGIHEFPTQTEFADELRATGFEGVSFENLTFGIVALHRATKPQMM